MYRACQGLWPSYIVKSVNTRIFLHVSFVNLILHMQKFKKHWGTIFKNLHGPMHGPCPIVRAHTLMRATILGTLCRSFRSWCIKNYWCGIIGLKYLLALLQEIWEIFISQFLVVLDDVENVNANVTLSVAWFPMST